MNRAKELDQWYTKPEIAKLCVDKMVELGYIDYYTLCIEPSCGEGVFLNELKKVVNPLNVRGFDLDPKTNDCEKQDWLKADYVFDNGSIVIGNPPYGKKGKLAAEFINHSFTMVDTVGFIVPITLAKSWTAQKKINKEASLVFEMELPKDSFIFEGKSVNVPSLFQIWKQKDEEHIKQYCKRLQKPQTEHDDLEVHIYNKMPTAKKWLNWDWDIAVRRNSNKGEFITKGETAKDDTHWILVKGPIKNLLKIDWSKLNDNKMTTGMGKADVVKAYKEIINEN